MTENTRSKVYCNTRVIKIFVGISLWCINSVILGYYYILIILIHFYMLLLLQDFPR